MGSLLKSFTVNNIVNYKTSKKITNCALDGLNTALSKKAPNVVQIAASNNEKFTQKPNPIIETIKYPFFDMPKDILNFIAEKTNWTSLKESKMLTNYNTKKQQEAYERALRGLYQNGDSFIQEYAKQHNINPKDIETFVCENKANPKFQGICDEVSKKFYELFDENLAIDKAHYNTPHERTIVKVVSGVVAAIILGNDFYNKSILNGKTDDEAKQSARGKRRQELIESGQEALSQYLTLGAFASFTNNSPIAAPILSTALSLVFRITSRLSTKRPIRRIKLPDKQTEIQRVISLENYMKSTKENKQVEPDKIAVTKIKDKKKHILSPKNILLACLASITIGFAGRGVKSTKAFNSLKDNFTKLEPIKALIEKYNKMTIGEVWIDKEEAKTFVKNITDNKFKSMANRYWTDNSKPDGILQKAFQNPELVKDGKILLGQYKKRINVPFLNIKVSTKELLNVPITPFKLIKELVSYPYKAVCKICEGLGIIKKPDQVKLKNDYNLVNTYLDYKDKLQKNNNIADNEFIAKFQQHLEDNRVSALNKETQSSIDNAAVGKTTQLLGIAASLYFSMNDDYNETAKQTGNKQKAQKDARLRGVNKIVRIVVQMAMMDVFNKTFKVSYAKSLIGAGVITAACTLATDAVSRMLSGMPARKMNKEQLERYQKRKNEGILKKYYSAIDKLTD